MKMMMIKQTMEWTSLGKLLLLQKASSRWDFKASSSWRYKLNAEKDMKKWSWIKTQSSALAFPHLNYPEMISLWNNWFIPWLDASYYLFWSLFQKLPDSIPTNVEWIEKQTPSNEHLETWGLMQNYQKISLSEPTQDVK